jgi:hypothetical protein
LIPYLHLNPIHAQQLDNLQSLDNYPWCCHVELLCYPSEVGLTQEDVLPHFGRGQNSARKTYRQFFADGLEMGTLPELVGGGLLRSRTREDGREFQDSDEQILGSGDFVSSLRQEGYLVVIGTKGIELAFLEQRIAEYFNLPYLLQSGPRVASGQFATRDTQWLW